MSKFHGLFSIYCSRPIILSRGIKTTWNPILHNSLRISLLSTISKDNSPMDQPPAPKKSLYTKIKEELARYWNGSKLFAKETKLTFSLMKKMRKGELLSRRERIQVSKTGADMIKLVPFSVFVIVPFLEFTLPFFLKVFPDMLPSTFEEKERTEMKMKRRDQVKHQVSKIIHDTLNEYVIETSKDPKKEHENVKLAQILQKYRIVGQTIPTSDLLDMIESVLPKSISVNSLSSFQLGHICRYMDLPTWGTDALMRYRLSNTLQVLQQDDLLIDKEGVDKLSFSELRNACQARGIVVMELSEEQMKLDLQQWIDLSVRHGIPQLLLILARALVLSSKK